MEDDVVISTAEDFKKKIFRLPNAKSLVLSRTGLVQIPAFIFYLPKLIKLDLSSNPLATIDPLWSSPLKTLKVLNLAACWLESLPIGPPSFCNALTEFYLEGNFLHKHPPNFTIFPHLKVLSLIGNDLTQIPPLPQSLETLYFRMNSFTKIPKCNLSKFDASYATIGRSFTTESNQITWIDLSHSNLYGDVEFPSLPLLSSLFLNNNEIRSIKLNSRRIIELDLSYNSIEDFPTIIASLPMLRILNLSHNAMTNIPCDLSKMRRLESIDISHNALITGRIHLPDRLQSINISFNFSVAFNAFPPSLQEFDASFCSVVIIPPLVAPLNRLSLYFVSAIQFSERMQPIAYEPQVGEGGALVPASAYRGIAIGTQVDSHPLMNERMAGSPMVGCSATSGRSNKYEDNFMCLVDGNVTYAGVFDGHVGPEAAFVSAETFATILPQFVSTVFDDTPQTLKRAMRRCFGLVNDELRRRAVKDGTTAVVVGVSRGRIVVANCGDSLAMLVTDTDSAWLTKAHRPTDRVEYSKLRRQFKSVSADWRVDGKLEVSRSLGDFWCCNGMYDTPDVKVSELPPNSLSVVLACDGLWDYIDEGTICNVVRNVRDPTAASRLIQDIAFASGSHDNISVIVINVNK